MPQLPSIFERSGPRAHRLRYLLHRPSARARRSDRRWPLVLFLHGAGERGDDLELVKLHGLPKIVEEDEAFPFLVASPQCPTHSFWYRQLGLLGDLVEHLIATQPVDVSRVYITGLSMGGYGAWHLAARDPDRFAAIAPICGGGLRSHGFPDRVRLLRTVPVWAFHGALDTTVPLSETTRLVDELRRCGGEVQLTVYPDAGHDAWTRTYENPDLYRWFLQHHRRTTP